MALNVEDGNAVSTGEDATGGDATGGIAEALAGWIRSLEEFLPLGLKPTIPPCSPVAIKSDPFNALTRYITVNIYIEPICVFIYTFFHPVSEYNVDGSWTCHPQYRFPLFKMLSSFVEALFWGWVAWYAVVKAKCGDNRCPCCLGRVCYLIMGCLSVLFGLLGLVGIMNLGNTPGCTILYMIGVCGRALHAIPSLVIGVCFLLIWQNSLSEPSGNSA